MALLTPVVATRRCEKVFVEGIVGLFGAEEAATDATMEVVSVACQLDNRRGRASECVGEGTGVVV